jgi:hypothetical protein
MGHHHDVRGDLLGRCRACGHATASPEAIESGYDDRALVTLRCTRCGERNLIACDAALVLEWLVCRPHEGRSRRPVGAQAERSR